MTAQRDAPGLWPRRIGLGEPLRHPARGNDTSRAWTERRPGGGASPPEGEAAAPRSAWAGLQAPGRSARHRTEAATEAGGGMVAGAAEAADPVAALASVSGTAGEPRMAAARGAATVDAGQIVRRLAATGGAEVDVIGEMGRVSAIGGDSGRRRRGVRIGDARAQQRARVERAR